MSTAVTASNGVDGRLARGRATRASLRRAAIDLLVERGYAGATTAEISRRAGVSPGLFIRYWPTKIALIADAAARAQRAGFERLVERWQRANRGGPGGDTPQELRLLVEMFEEPEMRCLAELEVAARANRELHDALAPVLADLDEFIRVGARQVSDPAVIGPDFDQRVRFVIDVARGLSLRTAAMSAADAAKARNETLKLLGEFAARRA